MSQRWEDARSDCSRGLVRLWLRHGTLQGAPPDLRTTGAAVPFVLERVSNTPARFTAGLSRARGVRAEVHVVSTALPRVQNEIGLAFVHPVAVLLR